MSSETNKNNKKESHKKTPDPIAHVTTHGSTALGGVGSNPSIEEQEREHVAHVPQYGSTALEGVEDKKDEGMIAKAIDAETILGK
ncbi:12231_t:CDS:2 [Entrophospora sp. SA101]|nr:5399_t:CDS:2 [Entrophospora sp. SA101]CAJ0746849.1 8652_t:CDS:2 [Entrophospora sp. SA101]CAJ0758006.1 12231_t:CDS:2 [Entrophospora sp. SA101]CAJ0913364.1 16622_t:CDS:2 [Entrophospora sp. SA101]